MYPGRPLLLRNVKHPMDRVDGFRGVLEDEEVAAIARSLSGVGSELKLALRRISADQRWVAGGSEADDCCGEINHYIHVSP
jgi:hypothetical protein